MDSLRRISPGIDTVPPIPQAREGHPPPPPPKPEGTPWEDADATMEHVDAGRYLRCRSCGQRIAAEASRCTVMGQHQHTFCNPHGLVFELGCFETAPGCLSVGEPSTEFTWFPGYAWQVALCRTCQSHLGWRFVSGQGATFFGLILPHLEPEAGNDAAP